MHRQGFRLTVGRAMIAVAVVAVVLACWKPLIVFGVPFVVLFVFLVGLTSKRRLDYAAWA